MHLKNEVFYNKAQVPKSPLSSVFHAFYAFIFLFALYRLSSLIPKQSSLTSIKVVNRVNNRDMSIAILRAFISKRKQEHEAMLYKRTKAAQKVSENGISEPVMEDGAHAFLPKECDEVSMEEPCSTTEECDAVGESIDISYGKVHR
ncbi:hypothetical protein JHK82_022381 [Glycine max]|nr:hypothetical protein JHK82_022381 [Glycine max]